MPEVDSPRARICTTVTVFVDTNVLVYRLDRGEPAKQARCDEWLQWLWASGQGRISMQVLQELYVTLTRKLDRQLDRAAARAATRALLAWNPVVLDLLVFEQAWALQDRHQLSWWDALIVSAAKTASCDVLLTEDLQHGQTFDGLRVVDPFRIEPPTA